MRTIGCLIAFLFLNACFLENGASAQPADGGFMPDAWHTLHTPLEILYPSHGWPRPHPVGTLLADHRGDLWMVAVGGRRVFVPGDDLLGEAGLDDGDAIPMTAEEERCLPGDEDELRIPDILDWAPYYGAGEDENLYVLNWPLMERRLTSPEAMRSWGRDPDWIDWYDFVTTEWSSFRDIDPDFNLRDGTLVQTESALYIVSRGRSYIFTPPELAAEAGYHPEDALMIREARLRALAPVAFAITHDSFAHCPADRISQ